MERPVKDGILYVQHCKFGKVKGGFGAGYRACPHFFLVPRWALGSLGRGDCTSELPQERGSLRSEGTRPCRHLLGLTPACGVPLLDWSHRAVRNETINAC